MSLQTLKPTTSQETILATLARDGACIIEGVLDDDDGGVSRIPSPSESGARLALWHGQLARGGCTQALGAAQSARAQRCDA